MSKSLFLVISGLPAMVAAKQGPEKFGMLLKCPEAQGRTCATCGDVSTWFDTVQPNKAVYLHVFAVRGCTLDDVSQAPSCREPPVW